MSVDDIEVKNFEEKYKRILFNKVNELSSKHTELIDKMQESGTHSISEKHLPNLGITLKDKLQELENIFQSVGISLYSQKVEDYGPSDLNLVIPSFIGEAIISDLIGYAAQGTKILNGSEKSTSKLPEKIENTRTNPLKKFFIKLTNLFTNKRQADKSVDVEKENDLSQYMAINDHVADYSLKDNIIQSIVKKIRDKDFEAYTVPSLIEDFVIPYLQKLELSNLTSHLKFALIEEYAKDLPDPTVYQISKNDMYSFVPDFSQKFENNEEVIDEILSRLDIHSENILKNNHRQNGQSSIGIESSYPIANEEFSPENKQGDSDLSYMS